MRKFFHYAGSFVLAGLGVLAIGVAWFLHQAHALDAESKAYVDQAVPAIVSTWSEQQLLDRVTPEFFGRIGPAEVKAQFGRFARLGPLVEYQGAVGEATIRVGLRFEGAISATYLAKARFQRGDAIFRILIRKRDGRWLIQAFQVDARPSGPLGERA